MVTPGLFGTQIDTYDHLQGVSYVAQCPSVDGDQQCMVHRHCQDVTPRSLTGLRVCVTTQLHTPWMSQHVPDMCAGREKYLDIPLPAFLENSHSPVEDKKLIRNHVLADYLSIKLAVLALLKDKNVSSSLSGRSQIALYSW